MTLKATSKWPWVQREGRGRTPRVPCAQQASDDSRLFQEALSEEEDEGDLGATGDKHRPPASSRTQFPHPAL